MKNDLKNDLKNDSKKNFSLARQRLYPHFKLTRERFPRLLATRKIAADGAEYFGAFLPETGVRFLIDFLNKTFRLRACEIEIDGSFDVPCTQFYRNRCVAPCVENLCGETKYAERVALVRLFLQRKADELEKAYLRKIEAAAEVLNFEKASRLRDEWLAVEEKLTAKEWNFWLEDAIDSFDIEETKEEFLVFLVTMRGRKTLGKRAFVFAKTVARAEIFAALLPAFYRFHAPREIRVAEDFAERLFIADELSKRFGRKIKIIVARADAPKILTARALGRTKYEHEFRQIRREKSPRAIQTELKRIFALPQIPARIEGFDVAHISASDFVAAKSVWENGQFPAKDYEFWFSGEASELETLRRFIEFQFAGNARTAPALVLIDGGRAHLQAALKSLENLPDRSFRVISAVKPPGRHGEIAHFLTETGAKIEFDGANEAHRTLQILRDEAHLLSNEIHRRRRETAHFYELAAALPSLNESERRALLKKSGSIKNVLESRVDELRKAFSPAKTNSILRDLENYKNGNSRKIEPVIVPLRYADENGDAQDLRPLADYRAK